MQDLDGGRIPPYHISERKVLALVTYCFRSDCALVNPIYAYDFNQLTLATLIALIATLIAYDQVGAMRSFLKMYDAVPSWSVKFQIMNCIWRIMGGPDTLMNYSFKKVSEVTLAPTIPLLTPCCKDRLIAE